jgi:hypothetical protein
MAHNHTVGAIAPQAEDFPEKPALAQAGMDAGFPRKMRPLLGSSRLT